MIPRSDSELRALRIDHTLCGRRGALLLTVLLLTLSVAGCGRIQRPAPATDDGYSVTLVSEPAQSGVGTGMLILTLRDSANKPVEGATLEVIGNMSHAGMVPVNGVMQSAVGGEYRVSMEWTMSGDWYIDITFRTRDGAEVSRRFPIRVE